MVPFDVCMALGYDFMQPTLVSADELPDSVYKRELRFGVPQLRFDRALEEGLFASHQRRMQLPVRVWFSLGLAMALLFTIAQTGLRAHLSPLGQSSGPVEGSIGCRVRDETSRKWSR